MFKYLKKFLIYVCLVMTLVLPAGCGPGQTLSKTGNVTLQYAKGFQIENVAGGCQKVTDGQGRVLLLVPRDKQPPAEFQNLPVIHTPVKQVVTASTTQAALIRPLGELGSIIGVNCEKDQWYIDEVKAGMEKGNIQLIGSGTGNFDYDKIVALKPDVVFISGGSPNDAQVLKKLEELKLPVAVDNCWLEQDPLGRLEWIKFFSAFYDKGQQAESFFTGVVKKTEDIAVKVAGEKVKPKILWGMIYQGKAYVPGADSYVAKMIEMAGGDYLFKDIKGTGSTPVTLEEYYVKGKEANIYIDSSMADLDKITIAGIIAEGKVLADLPALKEGKAWGFQPWYWQSLDKTDEVIADLAAIFHPDLFAGRQLQQFSQLPQS
ncbi:MAG TPA: ABC transporter substrate-binding protein [Desulfitobacteriaceae bacterium]|nr:ABC transporter substrate-binding protein [Desulfitobacteriaceae bacterium]